MTPSGTGYDQDYSTTNDNTKIDITTSGYLSSFESM